MYTDSMNVMQDPETKRLVLPCCGIVFKLRNLLWSMFLANSLQEFAIIISFFTLECLDLTLFDLPRLSSSSPLI